MDPTLIMVLLWTCPMAFTAPLFDGEQEPWSQDVWHKLHLCMGLEDSELSKMSCLAHHFEALRRSPKWLEQREQPYWPTSVLDCMNANLTARMPFMYLRVPRPQYLQFIETSQLLKCQSHLSQPVSAHFASRLAECDDSLRLGLMDFKFDRRYPPQLIVQRLKLSESEVCKSTFLSLTPEERRRASTTTTLPRSTSTTTSSHHMSTFNDNNNPFSYEQNEATSTTEVVRRSHELQTNWWFIMAIIIMACFSPCACRSKQEENEEENEEQQHTPQPNEDTGPSPWVTRGGCFYDQTLGWAATHGQQQRPPPYEASKPPPDATEPPPSYEEAVNA